MKTSMHRIVVSEYPKSGGNWVVNLIADALGYAKRDLYDVLNADKTPVVKGHPWYVGTDRLDFPSECVIKSHELPHSKLIPFDATYIHLFRDGRDVVVSKFIYETEFCVKNGIYQKFDEPFDEYVPRIAQEWCNFVDQWSAHDGISVNYEAFLADAAEALTNLFDRLNVSVLHEKIMQAVSLNTRERMRVSLGKAYKHNTFVRKGISGDWLNYFSPMDSEAFSNVAGKSLVQLGFEQNNDWVKAVKGKKKEHASSDVKRYCWCGNQELGHFSREYFVCTACQTLVVKKLPDFEVNLSDDDEGLYSQDYYLRRLPEEYGYPDIKTRARNDLPERCLYWLRALLHFKLPEGRVLELGCAHGGFVSLLNWAGFQATGLELSPWLVAFAKSTFNIPVLQGPVEQQCLEPESFDAIALMDVLEHLQNPLATMTHCSDLLKQDGIFIIQTPCWETKMTYEDMQRSNTPFLQQLKPEEHIYLFSPDAIHTFLHKLGFTEIHFLKAIFDQYDMFVVASRKPLIAYTEADIDKAISSKPSGRLVTALLDIAKEKDRFGVRIDCNSTTGFVGTYRIEHSFFSCLSAFWNRLTGKINK